MGDTQYPMMMHPVHPYSFVPPYWQSQQPAAASNQLSSTDVKLEIRQEPKEALLTVDGKEKLRKPVDPPPIIQLRVKPASDPQQHFMQSPYLFMCCSLWKPDVDEPSENTGSPALAGTVVSSLHRLKDVDNHDGGFFVFGDISVKQAGLHRLKFSLFDLNKSSKEVIFLDSTITQPFKVVAQKDFKGMEESTYLSRAFSDQGVRLRLRKEPRAVMSGQKRGWNQAQIQPSSPPLQPPGTCAATPAMHSSMTATAHDSFADDYGDSGPAKRTRYSDDQDPRGYPDIYTPTTHSYAQSPTASYATPSYTHAPSYTHQASYSQAPLAGSVGNLPVRPPSFSGMTPYQSQHGYHQPISSYGSTSPHGAYDLYSGRGVSDQTLRREYQGPPAS